MTHIAYLITHNKSTSFMIFERKNKSGLDKKFRLTLCNITAIKFIKIFHRQNKNLRKHFNAPIY